MVSLITALLQPYTFLLLALVAAAPSGLVARAAAAARLSVAVALAAPLWLLSTMIAGHLAVSSLEWSYPPSDVRAVAGRRNCRARRQLSRRGSGREA